MSIAAIESAVLTRFNNLWNTADAPIAWPNTAFDPPADRSPWIRISVTPGTSFVASLNGPAGPGKPAYRYPGVIIGQVFTKIGIGPGEAQRLADKFADIFRGEDFDGVQCREASFNRVGERDGWYQINVSVSFYLTNFHA